jgi:endonuclease/exonuclease/phosphatase family metal-dependent hydrolase
MAFSFRKFGKRLLIITNLSVAFVFLLALLLPTADPKTFWWLGLLGLAFPYLLIVMLFFLFFWIIVKPKFCLLSLLPILLSWKQVSVIFSFRQDRFEYARRSPALRVMTWNVRVFEGLEKGEATTAASNIVSYIKATMPDVVCMQEFSQYDNNGMANNHIKKMKDAGYPYFFFSKDYIIKSVNYQSGVAIFSKIPLFDTTRIPYEQGKESLLYADLIKNNDTVRIYTTHLQSFRFNQKDYQFLEEVKDHGDVANLANKNFLVKMKNAFQLRAGQATQIRALVDSCPFPEIVCGDFNSVPNSYAYWQIRGSRRDAFMEDGFGLGRTFVSLAPTLRIDYILCDNRFSVDQFAVGDKRYSDHWPLIADIRYEKKP